MQIAGLDDIDNRIIHLLLKNGRASYSEIGAAVGLSRTCLLYTSPSPRDRG